MYQSEWTSKPMLHLFPHWNWLPGQTIDLWAYYNNADEVELFINGKSQGVKRKSTQKEPSILCTEYHVGWRVQFEPGEIKAVSRKNGKTVCEQTIKTAGPAHHIRLTTDYKGKNTTFINVEVVDKDGNLCPWAENQIEFSTTGEAKILGTDNGSQTSMERFQAPRRKVFFGKCMVVVRGNGTLRAESIDLEPSAIKF
jgi:beta-galactosidase